MATDGRTKITAAPERWRLLGDLLRFRRENLGYRYRPGFCEARGINIRMVVDIERAPADRQNTFGRVSLLGPTRPGESRSVAEAYDVTPESVMAVLKGDADELVPAAPAGSAPAPLAVAVLPPMTDPQRVAAARPYHDAIREAIDGWLERHPGRRPADCPGAELFPDSAADARTWDDPNLRRAFSVTQMAWLLADIRRAEDARADDGASLTGT